MSFNGNDIFWIGLSSPIWGPAIEPYSWVIGLSLDGEVIHNFQDWDGTFYNISSVNEFDDKLYLGSSEMSSVGRFELPY